MKFKSFSEIFAINRMNICFLLLLYVLGWTLSLNECAQFDSIVLSTGIAKYMCVLFRIWKERKKKHSFVLPSIGINWIFLHFAIFLWPSLVLLLCSFILKFLIYDSIHFARWKLSHTNKKKQKQTNDYELWRITELKSNDKSFSRKKDQFEYYQFIEMVEQ